MASRKSFYSPDRSEKIAYPEQPLSQTELIDDEALRCMLYTAHRTGISVSELVSNAVKQWYDLEGDAPVSHIRWEIREGKSKVA